MSKFNLFIQCDNAAFDDMPAEVCRILRSVADRIERDNEVPAMYQTIRDINGNDVGRYAIKPDDHK